MKDNQRQLTLTNRIMIEQGLKEGKTFSAIAAKVDKDPSTISTEVQKHQHFRS